VSELQHSNCIDKSSKQCPSTWASNPHARFFNAEPRGVVTMICRRTNNPLVGRAAFETARPLDPNERVDCRDGARIIARSEPEKPSSR
jgi:hypothetical protein